MFPFLQIQLRNFFPLLIHISFKSLFVMKNKLMRNLFKRVVSCEIIYSKNYMGGERWYYSWRFKKRSGKQINPHLENLSYAKINPKWNSYEQEKSNFHTDQYFHWCLYTPNAVHFSAGKIFHPASNLAWLKLT